MILPLLLDASTPTMPLSLSGACAEEGAIGDSLLINQALSLWEQTTWALTGLPPDSLHLEADRSSDTFTGYFNAFQINAKEGCVYK